MPNTTSLVYYVVFTAVLVIGSSPVVNGRQPDTRPVKQVCNKKTVDRKQVTEEYYRVYPEVVEGVVTELVFDTPNTTPDLDNNKNHVVKTPNESAVDMKGEADCTDLSESDCEACLIVARVFFQDKKKCDPYATGGISKLHTCSLWYGEKPADEVQEDISESSKGETIEVDETEDEEYVLL